MAEQANDEREIQAFLSLWESEDEHGAALLTEGMHAFSTSRLARLASIVTAGRSLSQQANLLLAQRDAPLLQASFLQWLRQAGELEAGVLLVAKFGYPTLDTDSLGLELDRLARDAANASEDGSASGRLAGLRHALHKAHRFTGNAEDYYDPDNSYLNRVLESRMGLPITLSVLYVLLGRRLNLRIEGVALPGHYVAALVTDGETQFFDPFQEGRALTVSDMTQLARNSGYIFRPELLRAATPVDIVKRMLANLERAYTLHENVDRIDLVHQLLSVFP